MKIGFLNWAGLFLVCNSLSEREAAEMSVVEAYGIDH